MARIGVAVAALVLCAPTGEAKGPKASASLFRSIFGTNGEKRSPYSDADQQELADWLNHNGFGAYAGKEWIEKFDDEVAYDSIEDLTHLVDDDDYQELGMEKETAQQMQAAARKTMMQRFLRSVPLPEGAKEDVFVALLDSLIAAGYDEPDDVADLDEDEAEQLGVGRAHFKTLVTYADEYESRELLHIILQTYQAEGGRENPFASVETPLIEALVKAGVRQLGDIHNVHPQEPAIPADLLALLKADPRVAQQASKQEL